MTAPMFEFAGWLLLDPEQPVELWNTLRRIEGSPWDRAGFTLSRESIEAAGFTLEPAPYPAVLGV